MEPGLTQKQADNLRRAKNCSDAVSTHKHAPRLGDCLVAACEQNPPPPCHLLFGLETPVAAVVSDSAHVPSPTITNSPWLTLRLLLATWLEQLRPALNNYQ